MIIHIPHSIDINPGKFDIDSNDESLYLNKGKMQGLLFAIYNKNWETFSFAWQKCYRYLSGWHVFTAFRTFIETEWKEGLSYFLNNKNTFKILLAVPIKNRKDLFSNMKQYSYVKGRKLDLDEVIDPALENIELRINKYEKRNYNSKFTTQIFDAIL
jgi:hypothetical protein